MPRRYRLRSPGRLRERMTTRNIGMKTLAAAAGVPRSRISHLRAGRVRTVRADTAMLIAAALTGGDLTVLFEPVTGGREDAA